MTKKPMISRPTHFSGGYKDRPVDLGWAEVRVCWLGRWSYCLRKVHPTPWFSQGKGTQWYKTDGAGGLLRRYSNKGSLARNSVRWWRDACKCELPGWGAAIITWPDLWIQQCVGPETSSLCQAGVKYGLHSETEWNFGLGLLCSREGHKLLFSSPPLA